MADKHPWPWTIHGVGPLEWVIRDAKGGHLFNIRAYPPDEDDENESVDAFSAEILENDLDGPFPLFEKITDRNIPAKSVRFLRQLERLLKGPA